MIYRVILLILAVAATSVYFLAPPVTQTSGFREPETAKILFFHVPGAMLCTLFFLWGAVMAVRYLVSRNRAFDHRSLAAIEVGFILVALATVTGMVFAHRQWGIAWDWDPRQTTIFILLLIYVAYFALRGGFSDRERAAAISAGYSIFAFVTVPFLIWILPRLPQVASMHAQANQAVVGGGLDSTYRAVFYFCVVTIGLVAVWAYKLRVRQAEVSAKLEDADDLGVTDTAASGVVSPVRIRDLD